LKFGGSCLGAVFTLLFAILIASCSSSNAFLMPDRFETDILSDGSKRFLFEVNTNSGRAEGRGGAIDREGMELGLRGYFEQYPYCEEGFFLYDQGYDGSTYTMLGECQESAETVGN
jgi:hypothetical protein